MALGWVSLGAAAVPSRAVRSRVVEPGVRSLDVPGFLPAVLYAPGGTEQQPLIVAAHGAGGSPEWECEYWRRLSGGRRFVLCLRGKSMGAGGGFYYPNEHALEAELVAALRALHSSEPRVSESGGVYAGFSQGASMGSAIIARHGGAFPSVVLVEGFERWNVARARAFAARGGKRVLLVCGTQQCNRVAADTARWLRRGGVESRLEYAAGAGHSPLGEVEARVRTAVPWLFGSSP